MSVLNTLPYALLPDYAHAFILFISKQDILFACADCHTSVARMKDHTHISTARNGAMEI